MSVRWPCRSYHRTKSGKSLSNSCVVLPGVSLFLPTFLAGLPESFLPLVVVPGVRRLFLATFVLALLRVLSVYTGRYGRGHDGRYDGEAYVENRPNPPVARRRGPGYFSYGPNCQPGVESLHGIGSC